MDCSLASGFTTLLLPLQRSPASTRAVLFVRSYSLLEASAGLEFSQVCDLMKRRDQFLFPRREKSGGCMEGSANDGGS